MCNDTISNRACVLIGCVVPAVRSDSSRSKKGEIIVDWTATFTSLLPPRFCDDDDDDDLDGPCSVVLSAMRRN